MTNERKRDMVTVIIPTYNRGSTILRSVESVLSQTYSDLELIIVDDCSADNTQEVIGAVRDDRVRYIRLEKNQGACAARNAGIDNAKGEYIAFQDSDDEWLPQKLERQLLAMENTGADVCFCQMRKHYPGKREDTFVYPPFGESRFFSHEEMSTRVGISTQTIIAKRAVFEEHKFDPLVKKAQDFDWGIRASRNYRVYFLAEVLAEAYLQSDSITLKGYRGVVESRQYFLEKYKSEFVDHPDFEVYHLLVLARAKAMTGVEPTAEFRRIYEIKKTLPYWLRYQASRIGAMRFFYRLKGYKE